MAVHFENWRLHLDHFNTYVNVISESGFTLGIKKCEFAKPEIILLVQVKGKRIPVKLRQFIC